VVYGVIVTLAGLTASDADIDKAEGVTINLWTGLGMLALGVFFLALAVAAAGPTGEGGPGVTGPEPTGSGVM
jgi:hypothetical protein